MSRRDYVSCAYCGCPAYVHEHPDARDPDRPRVFARCYGGIVGYGGMFCPKLCPKFIWPDDRPASVARLLPTGDLVLIRSVLTLTARVVYLRMLSGGGLVVSSPEFVVYRHHVEPLSHAAARMLRHDVDGDLRDFPPILVDGMRA